MARCVAAVLALLALLAAGPCRADDDAAFRLRLDGGIGWFAPPKVTYVYSTTERELDIKTGRDRTWGLGFRAGCTLRGLSWSGDSLFGDAPVLELAFRHDAYDERSGDFEQASAAGPAAGYGATGVWSAGTWDCEQAIGSDAFRLGLWGSEPADGGFIPYVGLGYRKYRQDWRLNSLVFGSYSHVFDSALDADGFGIVMGGEYRTARSGDWQFAATPMFFLDYVSAHLDFHQSSGTVLLVDAEDAMGMRFGSFGASLDLSLKRIFGNGLHLSLSGGAVYNSRTPYGRPPTTTQGRAQIATGESCALRAGLEAGFEF